MDMTRFRASRAQSFNLSVLLQNSAGRIQHRIYAGVGSRETPEDVCRLMTLIASILSRHGFQGSTGDADGADRAIRLGDPKALVYTARDANDLSITIAREVHPSPAALTAKSDFPLRLMARNTNQVFGPDLTAGHAYRVGFLLCYTRDGCESHLTRTRHTGGTGQAIALASRADIPVFNLATPSALSRLVAHLRNISPDAAEEIEKACCA